MMLIACQLPAAAAADILLRADYDGATYDFRRSPLRHFERFTMPPSRYLIPLH